MSRPEVGALARLVGTGARGITTIVQETDRMTVDAVCAGVTRAGAPGVARSVRRLHRLASAVPYGSVHLGLELAGRVGAAVAGRYAGEARLADAPGTARPVAMLNGVLGEGLDGAGAPLRLAMTLRARGADVPVDRAGLAAAYGDGQAQGQPQGGPAQGQDQGQPQGVPAGRLAVFLHGLIEDETLWTGKPRPRTGSAPGITPGTAPGVEGPGRSLPEEVARDLGYVPVLLRYNSGLRVADNGASLGNLLDALVAEWPVPVTDLALIGHSMGGLIIADALARSEPSADAPGAPASTPGWAGLVRVVVMLGAPADDGAPLAILAEALSAWAARLPQTWWLHRLLDVRSGGIVDLRGRPRAPGPRDEPAPPDVSRAPATAARLDVYGDLVATWGAVTGRAFDGMVLAPAFGSGHGHDVLVLPRIHHQDLLAHPAVCDAVLEWWRGLPSEAVARA